MSASKTVLLQKLELSSKFLRKVLHTRKLALRVGLIKLSATVVGLALNLHLCHLRKQNRIAAMIKMNENDTMLQHVHRKMVIEFLKH